MKAGFYKDRVCVHVRLATGCVLHLVEKGKCLAKVATPTVGRDKGSVGRVVNYAAFINHILEEGVGPLRLLAFSKHDNDLDVYVRVGLIPKLLTQKFEYLQYRSCTLGNIHLMRNS